ncbi:MAG: hypothetical protein EXR71_04950 [Myxococcales bacterium]|nr:hypothetical protein [Myxococcales bacterium]
MVRIHRARSLAEATLVRSALERGGIEVEMRGLSRPGLAGGIPIPDAEVQLFVAEEHAQAATALLAAADARAHLEWVCPACGERNPASFETCWKCQHDLAGT